MAGIVFGEVDKICYDLTFDKLLFICDLKDIVNWSESLFSRFWHETIYLIASPVLLVILASIIVILLYLYKTSELMDKRKLVSLLIVVIAALITVTSLLIIKTLPPKIKFRLTFFPIEYSSAPAKTSWRGNALWHLTSRQLQRAIGDQAIVMPPEWIQSVVRLDSIQNQSYLKKMAHQLQSDYFMLGKVSVKDSVSELNYSMIRVQDGKAVVADSIPLMDDEVTNFCSKVSSELLRYFNLDGNDLKPKVRNVSPTGYQKYLTGQEYYHQKKYHLALDQAQQAIQSDRDLVEALVLAGKCCLMMGLEEKKQGRSPIEQLEQAYHWLTQATKLDSTVAEAYSFLGEYFIHHERWSLAEQMLVTAYHLNPNDPRLYLSLSRLHPFRYRRLGFRNEEQLFQRALFINPAYDEASLMLADHYLFANKRDQAIKVLERIRQLHPNSIPILMALGKIYLVRTETLKGMQLFNHIIDLEPENSDAYYNLGISYYHQEDFNNAEKSFLRAIAIDNHLNSHSYLAQLYEKKGDRDKAIEHLRQRIRFRKGFDDEFADEARKRLYELIHKDSTNSDPDSNN